MSTSTSKKQLKEFGYLIGIGFPLIIGYLIPILAGHDFRIWTLWIGIPILLLGILSPYKLNKPYKVWMLIGEGLGWINSRIILGIVFLLVLQPIAFSMKIFGYDPLRKNKLNLSSYKERRKNLKIDLTRIF